jgi:iron complex outermembrane receptor protein/outer membrane receptor for ferrienterochelin and colicins
MSKLLIAIAFTFVNLYSFGQNQIILKVIDTTTSSRLSGVSVMQKNKTLSITDSLGMAKFQLPNGQYVLTLTSVGFQNKKLIVTIPVQLTYDVQLTPVESALEEVIIVSSSRNNQRIENSPLKVEVLGREEMEEENTIKPANIASILGDVSGVQIQQSSAVSGNANVRIQGLDGRYTQILRDGLPLFDGFSGGFGILSIPPLDLKQVELIKGSASTLYGGGAIGGLVNIISRKPNFHQEGTLTLNRSTLNESNVNVFLSNRNKSIGYTFFGGYMHQKAMDVNKDGFSDLPFTKSFVAHGRIFIYPTDKTTITVGYTENRDQRNGGDMVVLNDKPNAINQFFENNTTNRHTGELFFEQQLGNKKKLEFKGSLSSFDRTIFTSTHNFKGNQLNYYSELSLLVPYKTNNLVAGINVVGDQFTKKPSDFIPLNNYSNNTLGFFIQHTWTIKENTTFEAGMRQDFHNRYGNFFLPRAAIFHRMNEHWATRWGIGAGYKTPNPLAPQTTDFSIQNIQPMPTNITGEHSLGYNAEVNYKTTWGKGNEVFINHAFFLTSINNPIIATTQTSGNISFSNASKPVVSQGLDTYIRAVLSGWELYVGYTYTIAKRTYLLQNQFMPLTPKNRMAFTIVKELEKQHIRFGLEGSYSGYQFRQDATKTTGYLFAAALVEKKFNDHVSVVLNGENLLDFRQSRKEALYSGAISNPVFNPLWAPIDGRVINLAVRMKL